MKIYKFIGFFYNHSITCTFFATVFKLGWGKNTIIIIRGDIYETGITDII